MAEIPHFLNDFFSLLPLNGKRVVADSSDLYLIAEGLTAGILGYNDGTQDKVVIFNPERYTSDHSLALSLLRQEEQELFSTEILKVRVDKPDLEGVVEIANLLAREHQKCPLDLEAIKNMDKIDYHPEIFNDRTNLPDWIGGQPEPRWEPHTYGAHVDWNEVRGFGRTEPSGLVPDHHSYQKATSERYDDLVKLRVTCSQVFGEAQQKLREMTERILGEQEQEKFLHRQMMAQLGNGTFQGNVELEPSGNPIRQMRDLQESCRDRAYRSQAVSGEIISVKMGDSFIYTGLVMVCHGMRDMAKSGNIIPEVIGRRFQEIYSGLS